MRKVFRLFYFKIILFNNQKEWNKDLNLNINQGSDIMEFKPLPIGIDNFEKLISRRILFIDKTLLYKDLLDNKAILIYLQDQEDLGKL